MLPHPSNSGMHHFVRCRFLEAHAIAPVGHCSRALEVHRPQVTKFCESCGHVNCQMFVNHVRRKMLGIPHKVVGNGRQAKLGGCTSDARALFDAFLARFLLSRVCTATNSPVEVRKSAYTAASLGTTPGKETCHSPRTCWGRCPHNTFCCVGGSETFRSTLCFFLESRSLTDQHDKEDCVKEETRGVPDGSASIALAEHSG